MIALNNVVLQEFAKRGLSINEGIPAASVDALGRRVEQYFGLSHLHDGAYRARFTTIVKNTWDIQCAGRPAPCNAKPISLGWRSI